MNNVWIILLFVLLGILVGLLLAWPKLSPALGKFFGEAYQKRMFKQVQKSYPQLAERLTGYQLTPESQQAFQAAITRLPPQEGMKLQTEFNRLRENFLVRHPEIQPLFSAGQDARAQMKAFDSLMRLPADKRASLEKDLIWAWDQLRGRFPKLMGTLEATYRKKSDGVKTSA